MATTTEAHFTYDEVALATRNHGMPLEALRFDLTPAGLHYMLVHYDIPAVDPAAWSLHVDGAVSRPLMIDIERIRQFPTVTVETTMECAGNGRARLSPRPVSQPWILEAVGNAAWSGVRVGHILNEAGSTDPAVEVLFTGLDRGVEGGEEQHYRRSLPLDETLRQDVLLAYEMNGEPLPLQHGSPLRLVVPGWYGMTSVKWLGDITVLSQPFDGYQHRHAYRIWRDEDDPGLPVTRILPRSLMIPPGIPDFLTRRRFLPHGEVVLSGRAWSGYGPIERVEVTVDGGAGWWDAIVEPAREPYGWHRWSAAWDPPIGNHLVGSRATDHTGLTQSLEPEWNRGGYQINAVQMVEVEVPG